jgi:uncharacterized OB-fold protein
MSRETGGATSLEPSVFKLGDEPGGDALLGSRCTECERVFFPQRAWCGACAEPTTEEIELDREGILTSFTPVHRKPEYSLVEAPYVLGEVTLQHGLRVYSVIVGLDDEVAPDTPVRLTRLTVRTEDDGTAIVGYAFTPEGS